MAQFAYAKPPPFCYATFNTQNLQFTKHPVIDVYSPRPPDPPNDPPKSESPGPATDKADEPEGDEETAAGNEDGWSLSLLYFSVANELTGADLAGENGGENAETTEAPEQGEATEDTPEATHEPPAESQETSDANANVAEPAEDADDDPAGHTGSDEAKEADFPPIEPDAENVEASADPPEAPVSPSVNHPCLILLHVCFRLSALPTSFSANLIITTVCQPGEGYAMVD